MLCPICEVWTEVKASRQRSDGYTRRRQCGNGHRFTTIELVIPDKRGAYRPRKRAAAADTHAVVPG